MAIGQKKDGRWFVYYRSIDIDGQPKQKSEYFGRGAAGRAAAEKRNKALELKKRRPLKKSHGPTVAELAVVYRDTKNFSANSAMLLDVRLAANILPYFGNRAALENADVPRRENS